MLLRCITYLGLFLCTIVIVNVLLGADVLFCPADLHYCCQLLYYLERINDDDDGDDDDDDC